MSDLDLYHRTTPDAAAAILREKRMTSKERGDVFFSTHRDGEAGSGYGHAVVHVRVPEHLAELDDEFPDGEQHYRVRNRDLQPHHFVGVRRATAVMIGPDHHDEHPDAWGENYQAWTKTKPHGAAVSQAQEKARIQAPTMNMDLGSEDDATGAMRHMMSQGGHPKADESFVMKHSNPAWGQSQAFHSDGQPGVALHPDRWDYGTLAHEVAHHLHEHELGHHPSSDEEAHGPDFVRHYQRTLKGFGRGASEALGNTYEEALDRIHSQRTASQLDDGQQRALDRLAQLPEDMIQGQHAHRLFGEHNIRLHEEDPWEAGEAPDNHVTKDTGRSRFHKPNAVLHTSQDYLWRPTLEHFIRHPEDAANHEERPSTWTHEGQHWINGGHHRILADRMSRAQGTEVSDRTVRTAALAASRTIHVRAGRMPDVHRGISVTVPSAVHDESRPVGERAEELMDHVTKGGYEPLGQHWSTDRHQAEHFARQYGGHNDRRTQVVFHATHPEHHEIEHDEGWRAEHEVNDMENEVPIRRGADVEVHGVSWRPHTKPGDGPSQPWTHHTFGEEQYHTALRRSTGRTISVSAFTPDKRIFAPTSGLDHRLWEGDHLRHDVSRWILSTLDGFWRPVYGPAWETWARVYFAGSEASEWTSEALEGNNDFDILVGVNYELARQHFKLFAMMTDEQITAGLNKQFQELLIPRTDPSTIVVDGASTGPWSVTWYVNQDSWDIRDIKPYAAYNVSADTWAVKPPHLPEWSIKDFPPAFLAEARAVSAYVTAVLALPEPMRSQQADALWRHLHSDRSRAFGAQGEGWLDPGNALEKYLDQQGLWEQLAEAHFAAVADPSKLLAPATWSNDPATWKNW